MNNLGTLMFKWDQWAPFGLTEWYWLIAGLEMLFLRPFGHTITPRSTSVALPSPK